MSSSAVGSSCRRFVLAVVLGLSGVAVAQEDDAVKEALRALAKGQQQPAFEVLADADRSVTVRKAVMDAVLAHLRTLSDAQYLAGLRGIRACVTDNDAWYLWAQKGIAGEHVNARRLNDAIAAYKFARKIPGGADDPTICEKLIRLYVAKGDFRFAWLELERMEECAGKNVRDLELSRALLMNHAGMPEASGRALRKSASLPAPDEEAIAALHDRALALQLNLHLWGERFDDAEQMVTDLEARGFTNAELQFGRALAQERRGGENTTAGLERIANGGAGTGDERLFRARACALLADHALRSGDVEAASTWLAPVAGEDLVDVRLAAARVQLQRGEVDSLAPVVESLRSEWQQLLEQWAQIPVQYGGSAFLQIAQRRDVLVMGLRCLMRIDGAAAVEEAIERVLDMDARASMTRSAKAARPTLAQLREHIVPADGALLAFLPAPGGSLVLWLDERDAELISLPSDRELRVRVQAFRSELRRLARQPDRGGDALRKLGGDVAQIVMPDELRERLRTVQRVAIVGRELLAGLPFECLPWSDDGFAWFGLAKAVHYPTSLALAVRAATAPAVARATDVLMASAEAGADVAAEYKVPTTTVDEARLRAMASFLVEDSIETLTGAQMTQQTLFDRPRRHGVMVLFAHGIRDYEDICPAGVLLAPSSDHDGATFVRTAPEGARTPADVVLLCTCGAGRAALRRGDEGARHLGGVLLQSGARVVGIADDDLELGATEALVGYLFEALSNDLPVDLAMRDARRAVADDFGALPIHWGLMRLEGGAAVDVPGSWKAAARLPWWVFVVGVIAAGAIGVVQNRRRRAGRATA